MEEWINLHNVSILEELNKIIGKNFKCITSKLYFGDLTNNKFLPKDYDSDFVWVYESDKHLNTEEDIRNFVNEADVLVAPESYVEKLKVEIEKGKLILLYGERIIKEGTLKAYDIRMIWKYWKRRKLYNKKNVYLLCNSAFLPYDMSRYGLFREKCLKWAYFSKLPEYRVEDCIESKSKNNHPIQLMWAGRLTKETGWKHPELALLLMRRLKDRKIDCNLSVIGTGDQKEELMQLCTAMNLDDRVTFAGNMSMADVSEYMKHVDIYLFTSDANEGWGVVLNEAMNAACCVIASDAAGATRFLVNHERNGLIFKSMDIDDLEQQTMKVIANANKRKEYAVAAQNTMSGLWSAKNAAQQLVNVCEEYLTTEKMNYRKEGPCSLAETIKG